MGHIVSRDGVATDPSKTEKVANWPVPQNKREVQQFLGLASYYRHFVCDYATIAKDSQRRMHLSSGHQYHKKHSKICAKLVSSPNLAFPDCSKPFLLNTDASDSGIGAVLSQIQDDGTERVVAYASRVLSKPERRYCVTRRELLAVVILIQHFGPYLLGNHFTLRTDHGFLCWLQNFKEPEGQLARWLEKPDRRRNMGMHMLCRVYPASSVGEIAIVQNLNRYHAKSTTVCAVINTNQLGGW